MPYAINHIHLKSSDPEKTAAWWVKAFNFKIEGDATRVWGDRFIRCTSEGGLVVNISGPRRAETLGPGDAKAHFGIEHFGIDSENLEKDIERLEALGAKLVEGPISYGDNPRICFIAAPGDVRVELIEKKG